MTPCSYSCTPCRWSLYPKIRAAQHLASMALNTMGTISLRILLTATASDGKSSGVMALCWLIWQKKVKTFWILKLNLLLRSGVKSPVW